MFTLNSLRGLVLFAMTLASFAQAAAGKAGTTEIVGNSGVSGQMMFLQSIGQVVILDKVENNPAKRPNSNYPAWVVFYNYNSNNFQSTNIRSNTFCAGGGILGDGRWIVTGGNKAVKAGGLTDLANTAPYYDYSGGKSLRFLSPCSGNDCKWIDSAKNRMIKERWYAWVEPMKDGHVMIIGGMINGGFVPDPSGSDNQPSYEFYPSTGQTYGMDLLTRALPLNLYPISYLMSDNRVFIAANREAILWDTDKLQESKLDAMPVVPRNYPANGGSAMLPMTSANNYQQTIIFCGGTSLGKVANWGNGAGPTVMLTQKKASTNCATITPLSSNKWTTVDDLPQGRSMGQFINLPDGTLWFGMGAQTGGAGYTTDPNQAGQPVGNSFADNPSYQTSIYDPSKPAGQRWSQSAQISVARLYHSTATLLPDSSILIAGSNPNPDVTIKEKYSTEYRVERWYPSYYDEIRPSNSGLPSSIGYGGSGFTLTMDSANDAENTKVVIIRTGFITHGWAMGQRSLELKSQVNGNQVQVAAMPANPSLFAPGTALAFVVVNNIPSKGKFITVGNGKIGTQPVGAETVFNKRRVQINSLNSTDLAHANAIADALNGDPVVGITLSSAVESMYDGLNQTIQSDIQTTSEQLANGTIPVTLSGKRKRHLHDSILDKKRRHFKA